MSGIRRIGTSTIPTSFVRLDTRVTTTDHYANAHDLRVLRENHNILLARRVRQPIFTQSCKNANNAVIHYSIRPASRAPPEFLLSLPITVPPGTREVIFTTYCQRAGAAADVLLYPMVDGANAKSMPSSDHTVTAALAVAARTVTIPIPPDVTRTGVGTFSLAVGGGMAGADTNTGLAVTNAGPDFFECATSLTAWDRGVYSSNLAIEPRRIVSKIALSGGASYRYHVDQPFNQRLIPNTDTVSIKLLKGVILWHWSLYCAAVTDFTIYRGVVA